MYSSAKKYHCEEGELILTKEDFSLNCNEGWTRTFDNDDIRLGVSEGYLEIDDFWYGRLLFKLAVDDPLAWRESFNEIKREKSMQYYKQFLRDEKRPIEMKKLFEVSPKAIKKLYDDTRKEREQFQRKNIKFNLDIQQSYLRWGMKDRKLKAFITAHSYVAWYEWTKRLLSKVFKAKKGKGPENDEELMKFLDDYPSLKHSLDTTKWGLRANQIRNCVSHEKFYFDYKNSELVFMAKKEKRVRLRDLRLKIFAMSGFYINLLKFIREKKGEKS